MSVFSDAARMHAQLRADSTALFRALDAQNSPDVVVAFGRFRRGVESFLAAEVTAEFRALMRSHSPAVRFTTNRMLETRAAFERDFGFFCLRWSVVREPELESEVFRDELEKIVNEMMKQIVAEEGLLVLLASVA